MTASGEGPSVPPQDAVEVVGVDTAGAVVVSAPVGQGDDPAAMLRAQGYEVRNLLDACRQRGGHRLRFTFEVVPSDDGSAGAGAPVAAGGQSASAGPSASTGRSSLVSAGGSAPVDEGLVVRPGEVPRRVQRVAAYAVVTSARGVLLTQFSDQTNAPGQWGLPGGGLDAMESPLDAVVREIWEEAGQRVDDVRLSGLQSSHWVGRAPSGTLEDFHALRVLYTATCAEPSEPVVHDVGGTTSDARWVRLDQVAGLPLTPTWRSILDDLLTC